jgi:hypothetical protein
MREFELIKMALQQAEGDEVACRLIRDVLRCAEQYVAAVCQMETDLLFADPEGALYREQVQALDQNRSLAHNALIDAINICNRYLRKLLGDAMPPGGIYPEPSHIAGGNRRAIGDWAGRVVEQFFRARR